MSVTLVSPALNAGDTRPSSDVPQRAALLAALLPARGGVGWAAEPYVAWWTPRPAARLVQGDRALVVVADEDGTEVGWQLPGREPYAPDLTSDAGDTPGAVREVLRLVLPVLDGELAARAGKGGPRVVGRLAVLEEIGHALRREGTVTHLRAGLVSTSSLVWSAPSGLRFAVSLHGTNPVGDVSVTGPVRAVERAVAHFLPTPAHRVPRQPLRGVRGRLARRLAAYLGRLGPVEQLDTGGLAFGGGVGPYGYAAPAPDPAARVGDTSPATVDLHGVGVDLLLSLAAPLSR
ncbi:hypothetical protein ACIO3O_36970 [Streptomyces sp. NPDC087440]|uniref:hypothetical protein n=1 Tax=Streptomyces sp. NPDC087440 TaxID=3365790 RepID=UPI0037F4758C